MVWSFVPIKNLCGKKRGFWMKGLLGRKWNGNGEDPLFVLPLCHWKWKMAQKRPKGRAIGLERRAHSPVSFPFESVCPFPQFPSLSLGHPSPSHGKWEMDGMKRKLACPFIPLTKIYWPKKENGMNGWKDCFFFHAQMNIPASIWKGKKIEKIIWIEKR